MKLRRLALEHLEPRQLLTTNEMLLASGTYPCVDDVDSSSVVAETSAGVATSSSTNGDGDDNELDAAVAPAEADLIRDQLLTGVSQLAKVGSPGNIAVFDPPGAPAGQGAFAIMHDGEYQPMVAAAKWGSGRIVAFGHNGYVDFSRVGDDLDTGQFYLNSVAWTSDTTDTNPVVVTDELGTQTWLLSQGLTNVSVHSDWENHLTGANLLVTELGRIVSSAKQVAVSNFVQAGGGLITGGTGWGYQSLGADLVTLPGNEVLREAGIAWPAGIRDGTTDATNRSTELANATEALAFAEQYWAGGSATTAQLNEAGVALQVVLDVLPTDHPLRLAIDTAFAGRSSTLAATPSTPVSAPLDQAVLTWESQNLAATPVAQVVAHHTAEAVYGTIPASAPRVTELVTIDTDGDRWHATGLYAAPGEIVTVTVPSSWVGQGYKIRINAHTDDISRRDNWERMPVVHRFFEIDSQTTEIASAFGGSLFIDFDDSPPGQGDQSITIAGAVQQPYFVLGEHSDTDWNTTLRDRPASYAVFVSERLINIIPKHQVESADLTEPTALMSWWNETVRLQDDLANRPAPRTSPEIINVDVQNSAGAAHAGFPIQAYERFWGNLADWDNLQQRGSWGDFHELGHNHQRGWWTFNGDGEVTVNIFSNYALENQATAPSGNWAWSADPAQVIHHATDDVAGGGSYASKSDRWSFWFQLADGFGWETYDQVFAGYEEDAANNPSNLPSNNQEEKDEWFQRWSLAVGYDMSMFMVDTWGLTVSQSAIEAVDHLPDWMPLATSVDDFQVDVNDTHAMDILQGGLSMDGVAIFTGASQPLHGTLAPGGGPGLFTYTPETDYNGPDSFVVRYRSSAGNTQEFTISVTVGDGIVVGDFNSDGFVDSTDLSIWESGYGQFPAGDAEHTDGDANADGTVNGLDFLLWQQNHTRGSTPLAAAADSLPSMEALKQASPESAASFDIGQLAIAVEQLSAEGSGFRSSQSLGTAVAESYFDSGRPESKLRTPELANDSNQTSRPDNDLRQQSRVAQAGDATVEFVFAGFLPELLADSSEIKGTL